MPDPAPAALTRLQPLLALLLVLTPASAAADAGIPMLFLIWPILRLMLLPVILIEGALAIRMLGLKPWRAWFSVTLANLLSTLLGIPLIWVVLAWFSANWIEFSCEGFSHWFTLPLRAAWLGEVCASRWELYVAFLVLLMPFALVSHALEWRVVAQLNRAQSRTAVQRWSLHAQLWSWTLLWGVVSAGAVWHGGWPQLASGAGRPQLEELRELEVLRSVDQKPGSKPP